MLFNCFKTIFAEHKILNEKTLNIKGTRLKVEHVVRCRNKIKLKIAKLTLLHGRG